MLEEVTCINYKIQINDDAGNAFRVNRMCLEKEAKGKKIVYYVRMLINIDKQGKQVVDKEYFFEFEKLRTWLYSMYSIGATERKKSVTLEIDDSISVKLEIISDKEASLFILNKQSNFNFELIASLQQFRDFQHAWKRAVSFL